MRTPYVLREGLHLSLNLEFAASARLDGLRAPELPGSTLPVLRNNHQVWLVCLFVYFKDRVLLKFLPLPGEDINKSNTQAMIHDSYKPHIQGGGGQKGG